MAIDLPSSPAIGASLTAGGLTFEWDGAKWVKAAMAGTVRTVNGIGPAPNGNVAVSLANVTTGTLGARPTVAGQGDVYVVSGDVTPANNGKTFIRTNGGTWEEISGLDVAANDARYVNAGGDTMTGALTLPGNPTAPLHAVPKQYVDARVGSGGVTNLWANISVPPKHAWGVTQMAAVPAGPYNVFRTVNSSPDIALPIDWRPDYYNTSLQYLIGNAFSTAWNHTVSAGAYSLVDQIGYRSLFGGNGTQGTFPAYGQTGVDSVRKVGKFYAPFFYNDTIRGYSDNTRPLSTNGLANGSIIQPAEAPQQRVVSATGFSFVVAFSNQTAGGDVANRRIFSIFDTTLSTGNEDITTRSGLCLVRGSVAGTVSLFHNNVAVIANMPVIVGAGAVNVIGVRWFPNSVVVWLNGFFYSASLTPAAGSFSFNRIRMGCGQATADSFGGTISHAMLWHTDNLPDDTALAQICADLVTHIFEAQPTSTITDAGGFRTIVYRANDLIRIPSNVTSIEALVVAGGGGGGGVVGGGGGAGGVVYNAALTVTPGRVYTAVIGAGGAGGIAAGLNNPASQGRSGTDSLFIATGTSDGIRAQGGGGGGSGGDSATPKTSGNGLLGGSGGGAGRFNGTNPGAAIAGQGNSGGFGQTASNTTVLGGGGGGGAGGPGGNASGAAVGGNGGIGLSFTIGGQTFGVGGGGGGGVLRESVGAAGGIAAPGFGGGAGSMDVIAPNGTAHTGGGGGGGAIVSPSGRAGGNGGSGLIVIRFPI